MSLVLRMAGATLVLVGGATGVALLAPGGLGDPRPQVVTEGVSADLYRSVVAGVAEAPGWLTAVGERGAVAGLSALGLALAWIGWSGWRRTGPDASGGPEVSGILLVGSAAVLAYLTSEAAKLVVDEERPCRAWGPMATWAACPAPGDWSFPSNHATAAGALAAGLVMLAPRWVVLAVPLAAMVAGLRVVSGAHYPHDVLAGLLLGAAVTVAMLLACAPTARRPRRPR